MRIQVLSDLHLEFDRPEPMPRLAAGSVDLVILAGDIDNHARGLSWAAETFRADDVDGADGAGAVDAAGSIGGANRVAQPAAPIAQPPVVYVAGNHEYYDGELDALDSAMRAAAAGLPYVHFLNNDVLTDPQGRWRVLGTTLWADFTLFGASGAVLAAARAEAQRVMTDFRGPIQVRQPTASGPLTRSFSTADCIALHRQARAWLADQLALPFAGQTIVVTHHAPHPLSLAPRYADDLSSAGFITDLSALLQTPSGPAHAPPVLWVHGHTHTSLDYRVNATRVICNPRGYLRRGRPPENPRFVWDRVVEI